MPRPQGYKKTGGRKKGVPNKKTAILQAVLEHAGLDVPSEIAKLLPELGPEKRADVLLELMTFLYPKRKAIEQQIGLEGSNQSIEVVFVEPGSAA